MKPDDHLLLLRALDEALSPGEQARFERLLATSAEARAAWQAHRAVREAVATARNDTFGPHFADRVMQRVARQQRPRALAAKARSILGRVVPPGGWHPLRVPVALRWGGLLAVVVVFAVLWLWYRPTLVTVPYGAVETVLLPDGSAVTLGSGARLRYRPFLARSVRHVTLTGEAFFVVAADEKPFVVETFNARVTVRGTRFNVRAWPDDLAPETVVTLEEGAVEVAGRSGTGTVRLAPGQTTRVAAGAGPSPPAVPEYERPMAWRTGGLSFSGRPLADVLRALERRYAVELTVADEVAHRPVTYLNPRPTSLEDALGDLCFSLDLRYRRTADGYEIIVPSTPDP
ncbi:MAG: anti-sigma factor [Rhodothermaceae bacterium]|nr:MAG: anti-sigma factor [Rhodothermaceae bacterium]